ncbi:thiamin pyrophosphokinase 1 [Galendromus occidentalis]|uniref:Thiamin pyrophosphokinase 1 n=1 Tax=Galendromus occidentalis TaxID=34638 RepID=A0AAJ6QTZ1_9ACAR|nr:thiamin pyrophosphokinase 1 [Galendromus occidentalis]
MTTVWNCGKILRGTSCALLVLNQPLNGPQCELLSKLWPHATLRVTVDGGSNRLFESLPELTPDLITGDLDSIRDDVRETFEKRGTLIVRTIDQSFTDFTKCLRVISTRPENFDNILAFCTSGGRFDQVMANINTLYRSACILPKPVILHSGREITWVLPPGKHRILTHMDMVDMNCGLLPIGSAVVATTTGLRWELKSTKLAFSELVSTSNKIASNEIFIQTDEPIVWTMSTEREAS